MGFSKEKESSVRFFCIGDEPKSGLARDLGDRLQSRNVPFGTSGDCVKKSLHTFNKEQILHFT